MGRGTVTLGVILFLIIVLAVAYIYLNHPAIGNVPTSVWYVKLTDPPSAPIGTESINITYSNLQVHVTGNSTSWINTGASGSVNLIALQNFSKTIGKVNVPLGSRPDKVRFNITSATIRVNNTSYSITIPNATITVPVSGSANSSSSILVSLSPSITPLFSNNSTTFYLSQSARGVILPVLNSNVQINGTERLNGTVKAELQSSAPNVSMTGASINTAGNVSTISVTVKDNSNSPVRLFQVAVSGNETVYVNASAINISSILHVTPQVPPSSFGNLTAGELLNGTFGAIGTALGQLNGNQTKSLTSQLLGKLLGNSSAGVATNITGAPLGGLGAAFNLTVPEISRIASNLNATQDAELLRGILGNLNGSNVGSSLSGKNLSQIEGILQNQIKSGNFSKANLTSIRNLLKNAEAQATANFPKNAAAKQSQFQYLVFIVGSNSSLAIPSSEQDFASQNLGYTLNPGQSATFTYNGRIEIADSKVGISLIKGSVYRIRVIGSGVFASDNVTAG